MRSKIPLIILVLLAFLLPGQSGFSQSAITFEGERVMIGNQVEILEDRTLAMTLSDVMVSGEFRRAEADVPNLQISPYAYWLRFDIVDATNTQNLNIQLDYTLVDSISFYQLRGDSVIFQNHSGGRYRFDSREVSEHQSYIYSIRADDAADTITCYVRITSGAQLMLPIYVSTRTQLLAKLLTKDLLFGIYAGIILVMVLYNGFIYLSLRDTHYLLYIIYLLSVVFTQATLEGYTFRFMLPDQPYLSTLSIYISSALIGVMAIEFAKRFLNSRRYARRMHKVSYGFHVIYGLTVLLALVGQFNLSYQIILMAAALSGIYVFLLALVIQRRGFRSARFFLIAWSVFIVGVLVYVLKDFGIFPYNEFTRSALRIGSAFEAVMLSFALADKINIYRKEREVYRGKAYEAVKENARIVREQNVLLEQQVERRTTELLDANNELEQTLDNLKETQTQLVESEKMASLGQLTAGIAHEINNPINFVTSNVTPLKRDFAIMADLLEAVEAVAGEELASEEKLRRIDALKQDADYEYLKTEIDYLLKGISEGATRTSDIVRGLRLFSRLDEDDIKMADIRDGLDSTLALVNHLINGRISVEKEYGDIPMIECFPGKLNQVFLNIMTNAIQAIGERWGAQEQGKLIIKVDNDSENLYIRIADNGSGMTETSKKKLFEPFFTTKDVGMGTGLGLSIVWNTIRKHNGNIQVNSEIGKGTEFVLTLPIRHEAPKND